MNFFQAALRATTVAVLVASCGDDPGLLTGTWTGRVLFATPTGVPALDSAAASTVTMQLRHENSILSGTVTGLPDSPAGIDGHLDSSDSIDIIFYIGGDPALPVGNFAGRAAVDSILGVIGISPQSTVRSIVFHRS